MWLWVLVVLSVPIAGLAYLASIPKSSHHMRSFATAAARLAVKSGMVEAPEGMREDFVPMVASEFVGVLRLAEKSFKRAKIADNLGACATALDVSADEFDKRPERFYSSTPPITHSTVANMLRGRATMLREIEKKARS